jgi:hypothetical protein
MASLGLFGSSGFGSTKTTQFILVAKSTIAPSTVNATQAYSGPATRYSMKTDVNETAGQIVTSISTRAAGELPQIQVVVGGPGVGETVIRPQPQINVEAVISGASQIVGVIGEI